MRQGSQVCRKRAVVTPALPACDKKDTGTEISGADTVQQHPHLHAARFGRDQRIGEGIAGRVIAKDIRGEGDGLPGGRDRGQHLRIGGVASFEHVQRVAFRQRAAGDAGADLEQFTNLPRRVRQSSGVRRAGLGVAQPAHFEGAACHPVDAEQVIKKAAQNGREPGGADPAQSAPHIAFLEQHIHGHRSRDQDIKRPDQHAQQG